MKRLIYISLFSLVLPMFSYGQRFRTTEVKSICNPIDWELSPVFYQDGLVFMSNRTVPSTTQYISDSLGLPLTNIYYAPFGEDGKPHKVRKFSEKIETVSDDGPISFAQDDRMLVVSLMNGYTGRNLPRNGNGGLYFSYFEDGDWTDLEAFEHNDPDYSYGTPNLSEDGRTLYFAALGREDSYGSFDLYVSEYDGRRWSEPRNLGAKINTPSVEYFPFIHPNGKLYFSSRGHGARGGSADLFASRMYGGEWNDPLPVSNALNTFDDELSIILTEDSSEGYITRKRGDDFNIYRIVKNIERFDNPRPIQRQSFCFRLRENSLDTIDYSIFSYEWVINDTLTVPGHNIVFCFPGPGKYHLGFNVTNKVTDTVMYDVATLDLDLQLLEQPVITASHDTARVGERITFSAEETNWTRWEIEGYYWDNGDDEQQKGRTVSFEYEQEGEYRVILGIKERVRNRRFEPEKASVYKDIVILPAQ